MNFFGFQFIIGNSSVTATKKIQNILSSSVIAGGIYGEHLSQNRRIDRISSISCILTRKLFSDELFTSVMDSDKSILINEADAWG